MTLGAFEKKRIGQNGEMASVKHVVLKLCVCAVLSLCVACFLVSLRSNIALSWSLFTGVSGRRIELIALGFLFVSLHFVINVRTLYDRIFRYRWLIAACVFVFLVLNQFNLSSIGMYDQFLQPGAGNDYVNPIFRLPRYIRGDEWAVSTPWQLSAGFGDAYGEYNYIIRGMQSDNISTSGLYLAYSALSNVLNFGFFLFGSAYGLSIATWGKVLLTLLAGFEFFRILTGDHRVLSVAGAVLVTFSSFYMWWSLTPFHSVTNVMIITVCIYRFLYVKRFVFKILLGVAIVFSLSNFVCSFYPAWQVPAGYMLIALFIWICAGNLDAIKKLKLRDWIIVAATLALTVSVIIAVLRDRAEYIAAISATVYPGQRRDSGGFVTAVKSLFFEMQAFLYPFKTIDNPSEASTFFALCPVSFFAGAYVWWKDKRSNLLILLLNLLTLAFLFYIAVGLPESLAGILLLDRTIPVRIAPFVALIQLIVLILTLSQNRMFPNKRWLGIASGIFVAAIHLFFCLYIAPGYMPLIYMILIAPLYVLGGYVLVTRCSKRLIYVFAAIVVALTLASSSYVNPVMKGTDVIYSKPAAQKILELVRENPEAKWITTGDFRNNGFMMACGAPTLTSVNYIPNLEMWEKLDPTGEHMEFYNRYHHIFCDLTTGKTEITSANVDAVGLKLSYDDLEKIGADYIFTVDMLDTSEGSPVEMIYSELGVQIYRVIGSDLR